MKIKFLSVLIVILVSILLFFNRCGIPTPVIHKNYKDYISNFSYFILNDTLWLHGGYYYKYKYKYKDWHFLRGVQTHYRGKRIPNKFTYYTTNKDIIISLLDENYTLESILVENDNFKKVKTDLNKNINRLPEYYINYENKIFLIGGTDHDYNRYGDVWISTNGIDWEQILDEGPWTYDGGISDHNLVVFNNEIILFREQLGNNTKAEVWSSTDGKKWSKIVDIDKLGKIYDIAICNGLVYLLGVKDNYREKILLSSSDLKEWKEHDIYSNTKYNDLKLFEWNNEIYSAGNTGIWKFNENEWIEKFNSHEFNWNVKKFNDSLYSEFNNNAMLVSVDAINWKFRNKYNEIQLTPDHNFNPDNYDYYDAQEIVEFKDTLWLFDGTCGLTYYSADGINWQNTSNIYRKNLFIPRKYFGSATFKDKLWIIGGIHIKDIDPTKDIKDMIMLRDSWYTTDGINWIKSPFEFKHTVGKFISVINNDTLYMIGGSHFNDYSEIWSTHNGFDWEHRLNFDTIPNGNEIRSTFLNALVFNNKIHLFDAYLGSGYSSLNFNGKSKFTKFKKATNSTRNYKTPDSMDNIVSLTDSLNNILFIAKDNETLLISKDISIWDTIKYEINTTNPEFNIYNSTLVEFKNQLFLVDYKESINSTKVLLKNF